MSNFTNVKFDNFRHIYIGSEAARKGRQVCVVSGVVLRLVLRRLGVTGASFFGAVGVATRLFAAPGGQRPLREECAPPGAPRHRSTTTKRENLAAIFSNFPIHFRRARETGRARRDTERFARKNTAAKQNRTKKK